jgi:RNA polymerase primary sigma factor
MNVKKRTTTLEGSTKMATRMPTAAPRNVPEDLLDLYFSELGKVRLLTAEDEVRLAQTIEAGREAQEKLDAGVTKNRKALEATAREGQAAIMIRFLS